MRVRKLKPEPKPPFVPETAAKEWIVLKAKKMSLEKRLYELKKGLEEFLEKQKEKTAEICGWKFTLTYVQRETFKLSAARAKLDPKLLKPFIEISNFSQIRNSWKGGSDEPEKP